MNETFSESDFEALKGGNAQYLDKLFVSGYQYVVGMLIYRNGASKEDAEDIYMDALLKFYRAAVDGKVAWGNFKGYLLKIALNILKEKQRRGLAVAAKMEQALTSFYEEKEEVEFDKVLEAENELEEELFNQKKIAALNAAWEQLDDVCRELLQDTIVNDIKPRFLMDKYTFKNTRVITDKKIKCKKKLLKLVEEQLTKF